MHSGVNYYYFHDGLNLLVDNGFQKAEIVSTLSQGMYNKSWEEIISVSSVKSMIEAYAGAAVGASGAIYGLLVAFAFMFPNAELALLFIPVPIKAKYFVPVIVSL